jgi:hypothetical protein
MTRIFISHSAKDEFAKKVRQRLKAKLKGLGLDPLVDEDLIAGDTWREKLHLWLGCCEGAIILFSRDALERSEWVKKEATILSWRKSLHPGLLLVPVRLGDVAADELTRGYFASLELGEIQAVCCPLEEDRAIDELVQEIVRPFEGLPQDPADSGFGDWVEQVAMRLRTANSRGLLSAARELEVQEDEGWRRFCDLAGVLAHHVLHLGLTPPVLDALGKAMEWISSQEHRRDLLKWLWFLWVREEAARQILPVTRRAEMERLLAINASEQDSGRCYVRRATCSSNDTLIIGTSGISGEASAIDIVHAFEKAVRQAAGVRSSGPEGEKALLENLRMGRVFFLVRKDEMQRDVLAALRRRFPMVTLVLLSGAAFPDVEALGLPETVLVHPSLEEGEESLAMTQIGYLQRLARVRHPDWRDE